MKNSPTRRSFSGFTSAAIRSTPYADVFAAKKYRSIASLGELDDRAQFKIAGAIVEVEKKFTKKEGKPFAVVWLEDLIDALEVVVWNDVYLKVSDVLVPGRVVELKATLDRRDEMLRAYGCGN
jgi:DNA polymerase-3 subunit alpha